MSYSVGRSGNDSRCCRPTLDDWEWIDFVDGDHEAVRAVEAWLDMLSPWAKENELGRIDDLMDAAARGDLEDSGDERTPIKPIFRDPEVYELRHQALSKKLRFYHGEPVEMPDALVSLHRHIKIDAADQRAQIQYAVRRYSEGRPTRWENS